MHMEISLSNQQGTFDSMYHKMHLNQRKPEYP